MKILVYKFKCKEKYKEAPLHRWSCCTPTAARQLRYYNAVTYLPNVSTKIFGASLEQLIHLLNTVTTTACWTLWVHPEPVQDVVGMTPVATHHAEVTGTWSNRKQATWNSISYIPSHTLLCICFWSMKKTYKLQWKLKTMLNVASSCNTWCWETTKTVPVPLTGCVIFCNII